MLESVNHKIRITVVSVVWDDQVEEKLKIRKKYRFFFENEIEEH